MKKAVTNDIIFLFKKETGESPVRARRREAQIFCFSCLYAAVQRQAIGRTEKAKNKALQSKYFLNAFPKSRVPSERE